MQVGTGSIKRSRASRLIDRWKRIARRGAKPKLTPEQWRARIAASRISFVKVEKRQ